MSFLSPLFLWGLPLLAAPVIIHLVNRRQRDVIRWGAMEFLFATPARRRSRLLWRDLLLMLLRILIVLAIVAALGRPLLSSNLTGSTGPRDVIVVLDNSMSTGRRFGGGTVFDRELEQAGRIIDQLNSADTVRVLLTSPAPDWLDAAPAPADGAAKRGLLSRLRDLKPCDGSADLLDCVQQAVKARSTGRETPRFVTVVTDGQAYGWRCGAAGAWEAVRALTEKASPPVFLRVVVAGDSSAPVSNLTVEKLGSERTVAAAGQPVRMTASVKNTGTTASEPGLLSWRAGDQSFGVSAIPALEAGAGTTVSLSQPFAAPGVMEVSCRIEGRDDLAADNSAQLLLDVAASIPILVVRGEPETDPMESDTEYFLAALGYGGEQPEPSAPRSVFNPKIIDYQALAAEDLAPYQCVVLANVPRLSAEAAQKLSRHVNSGGGLWIALGGQTDVEAFNRVFYEQASALSPARLGQPTGDAGNQEKFLGVAPPSPDHPATALLADTQRLDIDRARIYRRHQFEAERASVTVLLRAEGGAALALEKNLGRGRVIVQAFPLGLAWCNLPICHAYVVMVREWLWYLAEPGLVKRNLQAGEPLQAAAATAAAEGGGTVETPEGRKAPLAGREEGGRVLFRYGKTRLPGEYRLAIGGGAEGARVEKFVVNRDPEESNFTPLTEAGLRTLSELGGLEFGAEPLSRPAGLKTHPPPTPLAQWVLSALLILLAAESVAAFWFARRRRAPVPAVVMTPGGAF